MSGNKKQHKMLFKTLIVTFTVIFTLYVTVSAVTVGYFIKVFFDRGELPEYSIYPLYSDISGEYSRTPVSFRSGGNTLRGCIYGGENDKGLVVLSHGLGGGAEEYISIIKYFVDRGWRVMAYDNTGSCSSDGKGTVGLVQSAIDLDAALTYAENSSVLSSLPKVLIGHSWGGYAVAAVLGTDHDVKSAVSFSGYNEPAEMLGEFAGRLMSTPLAMLETPFLQIYNTAAFGDKAGLSAVDGINSSQIPIMVIHGENDATVSPTGAGIIAHKDSVTNPDAQFITVKNRGHNDVFFSDRAVKYAESLGEEYLALCERYGTEPTDEAKEEFYSQIDKNLSGELDKAMFESINEFFENSIK